MRRGSYRLADWHVVQNIDMTSPIFLDAESFLNVVAATPLVSIDLVIVRGGTEVLLGLRSNRPAQGSWFVPGGRVLKNEHMQHALVRISEVELGLGKMFQNGALQSTLLGVFEHFYADCFAGDANVSTHYVVITQVVHVAADFMLPRHDAQHAALRWWPLADAANSDQVHNHTKDYFSHLYRAVGHAEAAQPTEALRTFSIKKATGS